MLRPFLILSQVIMAISVAAWSMMALMSVMAFDSGITREAVTFVVLVWCYPLLPAFVSFIMWRSYRCQSLRAAEIWAAIPVVITATCYIYPHLGMFSSE